MKTATRVVETPKRVAFVTLQGRDLTIEVRMKADTGARPVLIERRYATAGIAQRRFMEVCENAARLERMFSGLARVTH